MPTVDSETGEIVDVPAITEDANETPASIIERKVEMALTSGDVPEVVTSDDIAGAIARRLLELDDIDVILNPKAPKGLKEDGYLNRPFELRAVDFTPSTLGERGGYYAMLDVKMLDDGEEAVLSCGGINVVATALNLRKRGLLPREVKVIEGSMTNQGFFPLWMVAPDYEWEETR